MKTLIDTTTMYDDYNYDCYLDYCEMNGCEPQGEDSKDYQDFVSHSLENDTEAFWMNLEHSEINFEDFIVTGTLGLWNSTPEVYATHFQTLKEAIRKCVGSCDDFIVENDEECVYVCGLHHDGRNNFEIRMLSDKVLDYFRENDETIDTEDKSLLKPIPEYIY